MRIEEFCATVRISAFSDHGSLRQMWTTSVIRQNRDDSNELFVLADGKQIPAGNARVEWKSSC